MIEYIIYCILLVSLGYLIGSIPFSQYLNFDKKLSHWGSTNIYRHAGVWKGLLVQIFDISKGLTTILVLPQFQLIWLMSIMTGQMLPYLWKKRGGKGVNTFLGGMFIINPLLTLISSIIFLITFRLSKIVALSSLTMVLFISCYMSYTNSLFILLFIMIILSHISNLETYFTN